MLYKAQSGSDQDPEVATLLTEIDSYSVISFKALTVITPDSSTSDTAVAVMETSNPDDYNGWQNYIVWLKSDGLLVTKFTQNDADLENFSMKTQSNYLFLSAESPFNAFFY